MPTRDIKFDNELSLSEMLADPIVQSVMARDGISRDDIESLIHAVRAKRAAARIEPGRMGRPVSPATIYTERKAPPATSPRRKGC